MPKPLPPRATSVIHAPGPIMAVLDLSGAAVGHYGSSGTSVRGAIAAPLRGRPLARDPDIIRLRE
jgi:hypothetical protein